MSQTSLSSSAYTEGTLIAKSQMLAFWARMDNSKALTLIWNAMYFKKRDGIYVNVRITQKGINISLEDAHCFIANAFLASSLFQIYEIPNKYELPILFRVHYNIIMDVLNLFNTANGNIGCQLCYKGYGSRFYLMLEQGDAQADANVQTCDHIDLADLGFNTSPVVSEVIINSEYLKEAFNDFDWNSELLIILISPDPPYFRLSTESPTGGFQEIDYPNNSSIFDKFSSKETQYIQPAIKALGISVKTQLKINEDGILLIQHMVHNEVGSDCFIDFTILPDIVILDDDYFEEPSTELSQKRKRSDEENESEEL